MSVGVSKVKKNAYIYLIKTLFFLDLTLENDKTKNKIKNKPPIPKQLDHFNKENNDPTTANFNMNEMGLHLIESDLKELNNKKFTLDVDDDDDKEEENENQALPRAHASKQTRRVEQ